MLEKRPRSTDEDAISTPLTGWREYGVLAVATVACLFPFLGKAVHMDDPLFLWTARQIRKAPLDFYGYNVNWYGSPEPMAEVMKNPPLFSYLLSAANFVADGNEKGLHAFFLLSAVAAILGTHAVARQLCQNPMVASLATLFTPAFLISSTNLMCDTTLLAFWTWSVSFWLSGMARQSFARLLFSAVLVAAAGLTKYVGAALVPLLFVHALAHHPRRPWLLLPLLLPLAVFFAYDLATGHLYGRGLFFDAAEYASGGKSGELQVLFSKAIAGLSYTGGCLASVPLVAGMLVSRRTGILAAAFVPLFAILLVSLGNIGRLQFAAWSGSALLLSMQIALFTVGGVAILALAIVDLRYRAPGSILLFFWVMGIFVFASFVNWTTNGRSLLPMAPAAGILAARRLDLLFASRPETSRFAVGQRVAFPLLLGAVLALAVTFTDYQFANANRTAAIRLTRNLRESNERLPFQGHWGFQYYMGRRGGRHIDLCADKIDAGKVFVMPLYSTNSVFPEAKDAFVREILDIPKLPFLSTYAPEHGIGFYSGNSGPLPFAFCLDPHVRFFVYECAVDLYFQVKNSRVRTES